MRVSIRLVSPNKREGTGLPGVCTLDSGETLNNRRPLGLEAEESRGDRKETSSPVTLGESFLGRNR